MKNHHRKDDNFSSDDPYGQNCRKNVLGHEEASPVPTFFEFFLAIILLEIKAIVCKKNRFFSQNLTFGDQGPQY